MNNDHRIALLEKYDTLLIDGVSPKEAAQQVGYSLRSFQEWRIKFKYGKKNKPKQKTKIAHIKNELVQFVNEEYNRGGRQITNAVVMKRAEEICPTFLHMNKNSKCQLIKRFMKEVQRDLPPPRQACTNSKTRDRVYECKGEDCEDVCRKKTNFPHKRIIGQVFKNVHIVEKNGKGKGLVLCESCHKGDFVIEYFGRAVSATNLKKYGGIGMYSMKVGQQIINGNIEKNTARFINHSCNPNCILDVRTIGGKNHACIFAAKKIKKGSELTFDYSWNSRDGEVKTKCQCGAKKYCKGYI